MSATGLVTAPSPRVIMKFGGSSVRDAERITEVCKLVVNQMEESGVRPHLVCSAMGKTTNNLLAATERAIDEQVVDLSAVRDLHQETAVTLGLVESAEYADVLQLLDECERTLEGVSLLGELSARTRDRVVSYGERCSGRMVAACLNGLGVPSQQIESWDLGLTTCSTFGDASVLDACWPDIKKNVAAIPTEPWTVGVITGFIGKDVSGSITTLGRGSTAGFKCLPALTMLARAAYRKSRGESPHSELQPGLPSGPRRRRAARLGSQPS